MTALTESTPARPKLLKARMRHTRYFIALMVPWVLLTDTIYPDESMLHEGMEWFGHLLVIMGVFGRVYCSAYIGGRKNDVLAAVGPYSVVRNPLYVFSFLAVAGMGLQSATFSLSILLVATFLLYYRGVIAREEAFLAYTFGEDYRAYMRRVPRWIPKFSLWQAPVELHTRPAFMLRTLRDALLFFLAFPLFELLSHLHDTGALPVLMRLP